MFHIRRLNNRINKIHVDHSIFRVKGDSLTNHYRVLYSLAIEFCKVRSDITPHTMKEIFELKEPTHISISI